MAIKTVNDTGGSDLETLLSALKDAFDIGKTSAEEKLTQSKTAGVDISNKISQNLLQGYQPIIPPFLSPDELARQNQINLGMMRQNGRISSGPGPMMPQAPMAPPQQPQGPIAMSPTRVSVSPDGATSTFEPNPLQMKRAEAQIGREESQTTFDNIAAIDTQISNINGLYALLENEPSGPIVGNVAKAAGAVSGGTVNTSGELARQFSPAFSRALYKSLTGDTRLSNYDASAATPLIPQQGENKRLQRLKMDFLNEALYRRKLALQRGENSPMQFAELVKEFKQRAKMSTEAENNKLPPELERLRQAGAKITKVGK